ncbi:glycerate kinase [Cellulomonas sp. URHD0024]|uniref:glycerate kinase family protein n=1 Tax=Cellulomonas sp. URHD0024 TaxID=1302620 RepID=UPI0004807DBA|nr:glycerate kinase [Cellulomonas sp. URHD0024]
MHGVRVLIAPDSFGSSLTADEAADAIAGAWRAVAPHDDVLTCPLSDGGPGFVATLHRALGGSLVPVTVTSPVGEQVPAVFLLVGATAYLESAQAIGLPLVPVDRRDPGRTTTRGVGELVAAALAAGAARIVVGLGGSATNDAGAGALVGLAEALGVPGVSATALACGGAPLGAVTEDDLAGLRALRDRLRRVDLVVATDVDVPLLGLQGASAGFAPQKGATPLQAQALERALSDFAHVATSALGDAIRPDLMAGARATSATTRLTTAPGAGAAGGLGFGLGLVGGRLVPGSGFVAEAVGLDARIAEADVVVTGEGRFDWQSLHGKAATEVASRALAHAVPTIVLAGEVLVGRRELSAAGITAAYAVGETPDEVRAALEAPAQTLAARTTRVARTWSR